jgi:hypothetical protein
VAAERCDLEGCAFGAWPSSSSSSVGSVAGSVAAVVVAVGVAVAVSELVEFSCPRCGPRVETFASATVVCRCGRPCRPFTDMRPKFTATAGVCGWCGGPLVGRRAGAKFCSDSHRVLAHRKRKEVA